jgi:hypothetical protein
MRKNNRDQDRTGIQFLDDAQICRAEAGGTIISWMKKRNAQWSIRRERGRGEIFFRRGTMAARDRNRKKDRQGNSSMEMHRWWTGLGKCHGFDKVQRT